MNLNYENYLSVTGQKDSMNAWKWWKIEWCGMTETEAIKASIKYYEPFPVKE